MYSSWVTAVAAAFAFIPQHLSPSARGPAEDVRERWARVIVDECLGRGAPTLDPLTIVALAFAESSFRPQTVGAGGEVGLLQIKPHGMVWRETGRPDLEDPVQNLQAGIRHMRARGLSCGQGHAGAIAFHNTGRCQDDPRENRLVKRTYRYRRMLRELEPDGVRINQSTAPPL